MEREREKERGMHLCNETEGGRAGVRNRDNRIKEKGRQWKRWRERKKEELERKKESERGKEREKKI